MSGVFTTSCSEMHPWNPKLFSFLLETAEQVSCHPTQALKGTTPGTLPHAACVVAQPCSHWKQGEFSQCFQRKWSLPKGLYAVVKLGSSGTQPQVTRISTLNWDRPRNNRKHKASFAISSKKIISKRRTSWTRGYNRGDFSPTNSLSFTLEL